MTKRILMFMMLEVFVFTGVYAGRVSLTSYADKANIKDYLRLHVKAYSPSSSEIASRVNIVRLKYTREQQTDFFDGQGEWKYEVDFQLFSEDDSTDYQEGTLFIYFTENGAVYEDVARFNVAHSYAVLKVTDVTAHHKAPGAGSFSSVSSAYSSSLIPEDIRLELSTITERYYDLSTTSYLKVKFDNADSILRWSFMEGAEEYDAEFVFIDDEEDHPTWTSTDYEEPFDYKEAVRIRTPFNHVKLDMVYPKGTLYFRVRPIGRFNEDVDGYYDHLKFGRWSYNEQGNGTAAAETYAITTGFEGDMNWTYQSSYAEHGKHKAVVSYFDPSGRQRQVQTNLSTEDLTLVGETKYDWEGRGVVQIMPSPKEGKGLLYEVNYNRADNDGYFTKVHFDTSDVMALSDSFGTGKYYSSLNPFTNNKFRDFIPTSQDGFPYSQVQYTSDNTGRVKKEGGVGEEFKGGSLMGEDHATEYYYGNPSSTELHRLFGKNVGKASHYKKVLRVDANEQLYITYLDQQNRTIATSLVGNSPSNLIELESNKSDSMTINFDSSNVYDPYNGTMTSVNKILNYQPGMIYHFRYDLDATIYRSKLGDSTQCVDCEYDLEITVLDPDGKKTVMDVVGVDTTSFISKHFTDTGTTTGCDTLAQYTPIGSTIRFSVLMSKVGDYTVTKKLSISTENIEEKITTALNSAGLGESYLDSLIDAYKDDIDTIPCLTSCEDWCYLEMKDKYPSLTAQQLQDSVDACMGDCAGYLMMGGGGAFYDSVAASKCDAILNGIKAIDSTYEKDPDTHPGYCHYELCDSLIESRAYDLRSGNIQRWADASSPDYGWIRPDSAIYEDPFVEMLERWDVGLHQGFIDTLKNFADTGSGGLLPMWVFYDPDDNPKIFKHWNSPDTLSWQLFRGSYQYIKLLYIDKYKELMGCDYDDLDFLESPVLSTDQDIIDSLQNAHLDQRDTSSCRDICASNVERWMIELKTYVCDTLAGSDSTLVRNKLKTYCENSCGDKNPFGYLIIDSLLGGNIAELNSVDSVLDVYGCTADSLFMEDPYEWCEGYNPDTNCIKSFVSFMNQTFFPDVQKLVGGDTNVSVDFCGQSGDYFISIHVDSAGLGDCFDKDYIWYHTASHGIYNQDCPCDSVTTACENDRCLILNDHVYNDFYGKIDSLSITFGKTGGERSAPYVASMEVFDTTMGEWTSYDPYTQGVPPHDMFLCTKREKIVCGIKKSVRQGIDPMPCEDWYKEVAEYNARKSYNELLAKFRAAFLEEYMAKCMENNDEHFRARYKDNEYHFTLYYYDQAGNLVMTVPPAGVDKLDVDNATFFDSYGQYIYAGYNYPKHELKSKYWYNSINQLTKQETPDGGEVRFIYDEKERLRATQSEEQELVNMFNYTKYDDLDRIIETGEFAYGPTCWNNAEELFMSDASFPPMGFDIVYTAYDGDSLVALTDAYLSNINDYFTEKREEEGKTKTRSITRNLRNRVSSRYFYEGDYAHVCDTLENIEYSNSIHYAYDAHGNVKRMVREMNVMPGFEDPFSFTVDYTYDLLSGNVKEVNYQDGESDQFMHRYSYDADNRITRAFTSGKGYIWEQDARYHYYAHGPLARVEIGEDKVQSMDYAYSLQGWMKAMNSGNIDSVIRDMGDDGHGNIHKFNRFNGRDALGYTMDYFDGDYTSIGSFTTSQHFLIDNSGEHFGSSTYDLYNGNIHKISLSLRDEDEETLDTYGYEHKYDQLNRFKERGVFTDYTQYIYNEWKYGSTQPSTKYKVYDVKYDGNGNIESLKRKDGSGYYGTLIDDLTYYYDTLASGYKENNQLKWIDDNGSGTGDDLQGQSAGNYTYDLEGNLIRDAKEDLDTIRWNAYGKVREIERTPGTTTDGDLYFVYDPNGDRVLKIVKPRYGNQEPRRQHYWSYTYYVRDAQGNVLATYERDFEHDASDKFTSEFTLKELPIYGSSRLGMKRPDTLITKSYFQADSSNTLLEEKPVTQTVSTATLGVGYGQLKLSDTILVTNSDTIGVEMYSTSPIYIATSEWLNPLDTNVDSISPGVYQIPANTAGSFDVIQTFDVFSPSEITYRDLRSETPFMLPYKTTAKSGIPPWADVKNFNREMNEKHYELTNHLGNVMSVVSDWKIGIDDGEYDTNGNWLSSTADTVFDYYLADVIQYQDYYPFGMVMPGRNYTSASGYRYGFNGMEKDDEVKGNNNSLDFGARIYDPRVGRWLSVDPLAEKYPFASPYNFALNTPIQAVDPNGEEVYFLNQEDAKAVVNDLNKIYGNQYGVKNAFKVVTEKVVVKVKNPDFGLWDKYGLGTEPEFILKEETRSYIRTNPEFDWNTDEYTQKMFNVLNVSAQVKAKMESNNSDGGQNTGTYSFSINGGNSKYGDEGTVGKFSYKFTVGMVFMHELIFHKTDQGEKDYNTVAEDGTSGPAKMRAYYETATGKDTWGESLHPGSNFVLPELSKEKKKLDEMRENTGKSKKE